MFKSRRWPFIDPLKEIQAAKSAIALRMGSRRQFIDEGGGDVEDVFQDNVDDEVLAESIGLSLSPPDPEPSGFAGTSKSVLIDEEEDADGGVNPQKKTLPSVDAKVDTRNKYTGWK